MPLSFERSEHTNRVVNILRATNREASYEAIAKQADLSVERVKSVISSARRILLGENIVFGVERGLGVKRLNELDKGHTLESTKQAMARKAHRGLKVAKTIDLAQLSPIDQVMVNTNRTILHMTRQQLMAKPQSEPKKIAPPALPKIVSSK